MDHLIVYTEGVTLGARAQGRGEMSCKMWFQEENRGREYCGEAAS